MEFVFGYGSLAAGPGEHARLSGHRRVWGVAMDNRVVIPGYKSYADPDTGERPEVFVAFLDLEPQADGVVDGLLLEAGPGLLAALDERERNYERHDVSALVDSAPGRVWTYVGSPDGRARLAEGRRTGTAVVSREYAELARADPEDLPVRDLIRIDHTAGHNPRSGR